MGIFFSPTQFSKGKGKFLLTCSGNTAYLSAVCGHGGPGGDWKKRDEEGSHEGKVRRKPWWEAGGESQSREEKPPPWVLTFCTVIQTDVLLWKSCHLLGAVPSRFKGKKKKTGQNWNYSRVSEVWQKCKVVTDEVSHSAINLSLNSIFSVPLAITGSREGTLIISGWEEHEQCRFSNFCIFLWWTYINCVWMQEKKGLNLKGLFLRFSPHFQFPVLPLPPSLLP